MEEARAMREAQERLETLRMEEARAKREADERRERC